MCAVDELSRGTRRKAFASAFLLVASLLALFSSGCSSHNGFNQRACRSRSSSIGLGATINICPSIQSVEAVPTSAPVGSDVHLEVVADDPDSKDLSFSWTPEGEGPIHSAGSMVTFRCSTPGVVKMVVVVSDGECDDSEEFAFLCTCPVDAGACDASP
jgi:hypothetical protein